jgi:hypothetical protein
VGRHLPASFWLRFHFFVSTPQITLTKKPIMIMVAQKKNFRMKEIALDSQVALVTKIFSAVSICC